MRKRTVSVNDKMQRGYRCAVTAPAGRGFDPEFKPQLTPRRCCPWRLRRQIHDRLPRGVSGSWFAVRSSRRGDRDPSLNFFKVDATAALGWNAKAGSSGRSARLVSVVLPLLHRPAYAGRGPAADQALEGDGAARPPGREILRARRPALPRRQRQALLHWAYDSRKISFEFIRRRLPRPRAAASHACHHGVDRDHDKAPGQHLPSRPDAPASKIQHGLDFPNGET